MTRVIAVENYLTIENVDLEHLPIPELIELTYQQIARETDCPDEYCRAVTALNGEMDTAHQHPQDIRTVCIAFLYIYGGPQRLT